MLRVVEHRAGVAALHHLALLHDDDAVADVVGGGEVVGDVDDRDAEIVAQRLEQIDDRHAQRRVDHRHRLVGDDQRRTRDQRPRDRHPLQLAAGELVRKPPLHLGEGEADLAQRLVGEPLGLGPRRAPAKRARRRQQIAVDPLQRIEGLERVLEDRLDRGHEGHARLWRPRMRDRSAPRKRIAPSLGSTRSEDHARQRRLAAAGLADDREYLRRRVGDREADVVDRAERRAPKSPPRE